MSQSPPGAARDLRHDLVTIAGSLVAELGADAVSLREVARRAGASHAAPGHHFGDKSGMLTAVATETFDRFADHLEVRVAERAATGVDRLAVAGTAYVEFARANPALFEFMFRHERFDCGDEAYLLAAARSYGVLERAVDAARATGWAAGADRDDLVRLCWATAHGLATLPDTAHDTGPVDAGLTDVERLLRVQLDALATTG